MAMDIPRRWLDAAGIRSADDVVVDVTSDGLVLRPDTLRKVYVEATGRCNMACAMCPRIAWDASAGDMSDACFQALLDGLPDAPPDTLTLAFGGFGEPTVHPRFGSMVDTARRAGRRVEVITNATTMTPTLASSLVDQGVAQVTVSIDGGDDEAYAAMRGRHVHPVLAGIEHVREARRRARSRLSLGLSCVVTRRNAASLPALLDAATRLDLDFVALTGVVPTTPEMAADSLSAHAAQLSGYDPAATRPRIVLGRLDLSAATRPLLEHLLKELPVLPPPAMDPGTWQNRCRFVREGVCAVTWDGRVAPCLSLLYTHPEFIGGRQKTVQACTLGQVEQTPLRAIWTGEAYRAFRRRVRTFDVSPCLSCGGCDISATNEADCFGTPFPACSECLWAQGLVLCP
jgi:MoaA/NifB/PqqE/SkfB family radical SAM enzyme